MFGGKLSDIIYDDIWEFDLINRSWQQIGTIPTKLLGFASTL